MCIHKYIQQLLPAVLRGHEENTQHCWDGIHTTLCFAYAKCVLYHLGRISSHTLKHTCTHARTHILLIILPVIILCQLYKKVQKGCVQFNVFKIKYSEISVTMSTVYLLKHFPYFIKKPCIFRFSPSHSSQFSYLQS